MNTQNRSMPFGRSNQVQNGMQGQQMPNQNFNTPMFGQVQAPPTIPNISNQPRLQQFQSISNGQTQQPQGSSPQLLGKFINDPSEIDPRDIPFDGSVVYFPLNDFSRIIAKAWDNMSNLMTVTYVPENQQQSCTTQQTPDQTVDDTVSAMNSRMDRIEEMLNKLVEKKQDNRSLPGNNRTKGVNQNGEQQ